MRNLRVLTLALSVVLVAGLAEDALADPQRGAHKGGGRIANQRQERQMKRIGSGVGSGELTRREKRGLMKGERKINRFERKAKADDGRIGAREAKRLDHMQDRQSKAINNQKHDGQDRTPNSSASH